MSRRRKILVITAVVLATGLLFTAFILPLIVRSQLVKQVGKATARVCSVDKVSINPLNWSVKVKGVRLAEKDARATFVSFSSLGFRVSPTSIFRMAPVVNDLKLRSPYVHLVRTGPNSYNFTDILERQPKSKDKSPLRFSLNNIVIDGGRVEFEDLAPAKPTRHDVRDIAIQLPFISSISYFADRYVDPSLSALVNGAPFRFNGKLRPFAKGMEATVRLDLKQVDLPYYAAYFPATLPVKFSSGTLSTELEISHRLVSGGKPDITVSGRAGLQGLGLSGRSGQPLLALKGLVLEIARAGFLTKDFDVASLVIEAPDVKVTRNTGGGWNFSELRGEPAGESPPEKESAADDTTKARVKVRSLAIHGGRVHFRDAVPRGGFDTDLLGVELKTENLATYGDTPATWQLAFASARGSRPKPKGA